MYITFYKKYINNDESKVIGREDPKNIRYNLLKQNLNLSVISDDRDLVVHKLIRTLVQRYSRYRKPKWRWKVTRKSSQIWKMWRTIKRNDFRLTSKLFDIRVVKRERTLQSYIQWKLNVSYQNIQQIKIYFFKQNVTQNSLLLHGIFSTGNYQNKEFNQTHFLYNTDSKKKRLYIMHKMADKDIRKHWGCGIRKLIKYYPRHQRFL